LARQARIQGTVRLELDYNRESGEITDVKATSGHPLLTPAAVAAARKWKLDAASTGGEPVSVSLEFSIGCP
jgi:TonB family protein